MKPSKALNRHRADVRRIVAKYRACNPRVFGSVLHGTDTDASDIDLLVDKLPGMTLFDLAGIIHELGELLGVPVDVATPGCLRQEMRARVLADARPV